ncbi:MAG: iron-sulfur cluster assembly protein [bacterium]
MEKKEIVDALSEVLDPEIGMDIVTLGLIYDIDIEDSKVNIDMTLTFPGCPLANVMVNSAKEKIESLEDVTEANVNLVFEPRWEQSMVSEDNYKKLLENDK